MAKKWLLFFGILVSSALFMVSLVAHLSTFFNIDFMDISDIWWLHILIFPIVGIAIMMVNQIAKKEKEAFNLVLRHAPLWMQLGLGICFAYAILNFVVSILILNEGLSPIQEGNRYMLKSHGKVIREITEAEYHRHRAYVTRGFSGHWLLFYSLIATMLAGVQDIQRRRANGEALKLAPVEQPRPTRKVTDQSPPFAINSKVEKGTPKRRHTRSGEPAPVWQGLLSLLFYAGIVSALFSGQLALNFLGFLVAAVSAFLFVRRRRSMAPKDNSMETLSGCLSLPPNFFMSVCIGVGVGQFLYLAFACGLMPAIMGEVSFQSSTILSNGQSVNGKIWGAMQILVVFPSLICSLAGLTHLMETFGRFCRI